jgi:autotransporter-associated beta strand protein
VSRAVLGPGHAVAGNFFWGNFLDPFHPLGGFLPTNFVCTGGDFHFRVVKEKNLLSWLLKMGILEERTALYPLGSIIMCRRLPLLIVVALVTLFHAATAKATPYTWIGPEGGNLTNPDNWDPSGGVPDPYNDDRFIANGNSAVLDADFGTATLFLGDPSGAADNSLSIPDHTLTVNGYLYLGMGNGNGTITQTGGALQSNYLMYLGNGASNGYAGLGAGVYNLSGGTILGDGSYLYLGMNGPGTLSQSGGASAAFSSVYLGNLSYSQGLREGWGKYDLTDGSLDVGNQLFVGYRYNGAFTLKNSSAATVHGGIVMGTSAGDFTQTDSINVQDDASLTIAGGLNMKGNAKVTGTVNQSGGHVIVDQIYYTNNTGPGDNFYKLSGGTLTLGPGAAGLHAVSHFQITGGLVDTDQDTVPTLQSDKAFDVQGGTVNVILGGTFSGVALQKTGVGTTATLGAANTYTGETKITAGTLALSAEGQISTGSLINNADQFLIEGGEHTLGIIAGGGTTTIQNSASVTVASIAQGALIIGSGTRAAPVPEPSGLLLLAVAGFFFVWRGAFRTLHENSP